MYIHEMSSSTVVLYPTCFRRGASIRSAGAPSEVFNWSDENRLSADWMASRACDVLANVVSAMLLLIPDSTQEHCTEHSVLQ